MRLYCFLSMLLFGTASVAAEIVGGNPVTVGDCPLLSRDVTLRLSVGVRGAWMCGGGDKSIKVAACSQYGSRAPTSVLCVPIGRDGDGYVIYNASGCDAAPGAGVVLSGGRFFVASSEYAAPALVVVDSVCDDSIVSSLDFFSK